MILRSKAGEKFLGHNYIISSRKNFDILYFKVERELRVGLSNNDGKVIGGVILLITDNQFDDTILTNGRQIRQLIDSSCFQQFVQLFSANFKAHILRRKSDLFVRRSDDNIGISKEICLLYTSPSPRDRQKSRMPSSA